MRPVEEVNRKLEERRRRAKREREKRRKEALSLIPNLEELEEEIRRLGMNRLREGLGAPGSSRKALEEAYEKRRRLLQAHGFPEDYLERRPFCSLCDDTGVYRGSICRCKRQMLVEARYEMSGLRSVLERENFETFDLNLFRKNRLSSERYSPYEMIVHAKKKAEEFVKRFSESPPPLFLSGPVGTGKSFLCHAVAKEILERGYSVLYLTAPKLMTVLSNIYYSPFPEKERAREEYEELTKLDLLIIDDLGAEAGGANFYAHFFELFNERLIQKKPMIISTNLMLSEIETVYDARISSRIAGSFTKLSFMGDDLRRRRPS